MTFTLCCPAALQSLRFQLYRPVAPSPEATNAPWVCDECKDGGDGSCTPRSLADEFFGTAPARLAEETEATAEGEEPTQERTELTEESYKV